PSPSGRSGRTSPARSWTRPPRPRPAPRTPPSWFGLRAPARRSGRRVGQDPRPTLASPRRVRRREAGSRRSCPETVDDEPPGQGFVCVREVGASVGTAALVPGGGRRDQGTTDIDKIPKFMGRNVVANGRRRRQSVVRPA